MSSHLLRKYMDIINESIREKVDNPYAVGMAVAKKKYGYGEETAHDLPKKVIKKAHEIAKKVDEKWDTETTVSPSESGKYAGKTVKELRKAYDALKATGPHPRGSTEYGRMRELAFAIRAKTGWGGVS